MINHLLTEVQTQSHWQAEKECEKPKQILLESWKLWGELHREDAKKATQPNILGVGSNGSGAKFRKQIGITDKPYRLWRDCSGRSRVCGGIQLHMCPRIVSDNTLQSKDFEARNQWKGTANKEAFFTAIRYKRLGLLQFLLVNGKPGSVRKR